MGEGEEVRVRERHMWRKSHCKRRTQRKSHVSVRELKDRGRNSLTNQAFMLADNKNTSSFNFNK